MEKFTKLKSENGTMINFLESDNEYLTHNFDGDTVTQGIPDYELQDVSCIKSRLEDLYHDQKLLNDTEIQEAIIFLENQISKLKRGTMEKISKRLNTEHVEAMTKALEIIPHFVVVKTKSTVLVKTKAGAELYRALKLGSVDLWAVRHVANLFNKEG